MLTEALRTNGPSPGIRVLGLNGMHGVVLAGAGKDRSIVRDPPNDKIDLLAFLPVSPKLIRIVRH